MAFFILWRRRAAILVASDKEAEVVTKELIKSEIDKVPDEHLGVLYKIVKALEEPGRMGRPAWIDRDDEEDWRRFVAETYGSMRDSPIERGDPGQLEERIPFE